jgi:dihydroflavonol-4-reductase
LKALVTGSNGLIGSNLVRELVRHRAEVRAMVRTSSRVDALDGIDVPKVVGDVLDSQEALAGMMAGCDLVFHCAARFTYGRKDEKVLQNTAIVGTQNVLRAAALAGVRRVVVTSSSVVYGSSSLPEIHNEKAPIQLQSADGFIEPAYVISKIKQDQVAVVCGRQLGLEVLLACPTLAVGPYDTSLGPSNGLIVGYLSDAFRITFPGGANIVSVRDVAHGHWLIATRGLPGEHYVLGGENLHWHAIHELIAGLCGVERPRVQINHSLAFSAAAFEEVRAQLTQREALTTRDQARMVGRYYWYSHDKAGSLGYRPMKVRSALAEACAWLGASPHISREVRSTMQFSNEVFEARRQLRQAVP